MTGPFRLLSFAAIAQEDEEYRFATPFGVEVHRRRAGEPLHPEREPLEVLQEQRQLLGSRYFAAQYLQAPTPAEGNIVKRAWFGRYTPADALAPERVIQSWDTASKATELNDFSVGTTWAIKGGRALLLDVYRVRLELPALKRKVIELAELYNAERVLIEDKGSGTALLQELPAAHFYRGIPILPRGDKLMRLAGVTPMIEGGHVLLPERAPWLDAFEDEICGFPAVRHDDQVDSLSQALDWIREHGATPGIIEYYRQEALALRAAQEDRTVHLRAPEGISHFVGIDGIMHPVDPDRTIWLTERDARSACAGGFVVTGRPPHRVQSVQASPSSFPWQGHNGLQ